MKAPSLLRHIWISCIICTLFLAATGVAYANASNNGANGKADSSKQELVVKQEDTTPNNKIEAAAMPTQSAAATKTEPKPAEVKKEGATTGFFSFSFLYYLFYKTNFAETTNNAFRNSCNKLISCLID